MCLSFTARFIATLLLDWLSWRSRDWRKKENQN